VIVRLRRRVICIRQTGQERLLEFPLVFPDENAIIMGHGLVNRKRGRKGIARPGEDLKLLNELGQKSGNKKFYLPNQILDTHEIARQLDIRVVPVTSDEGYGLEDLVRVLGGKVRKAHDARNDVRMNYDLFERLQEEAKKQGKQIQTLNPKFDKGNLYYENYGGFLGNNYANEISGTSGVRGWERIGQGESGRTHYGGAARGRQPVRLEMDRRYETGHQGQDGTDDGRREGAIREGERIRSIYPKSGLGRKDLTLRYQSGGPIPGYGGGDIIPVLAEGGEYIVRKEAARYARPVLDAINSGSIKGYSREGSVDPVYAVTGANVEDEFNRITRRGKDAFGIDAKCAMV